MNWTEFKQFDGIDINDYFVLDWCLANDILILNIEASIWPQSSYYTKPKKMNSVVTVIYYWKKPDREIWMLTIYSKSERPTIPGHILKQIAEPIDHE